MRKRILVTGSTGFIGKHLVDELNNMGHRVLPMSSIHGDISSKNVLQDFAPDGADIVYHLAGLTGIMQSWRNPADFYTVNTIGTQRILDYCHTHQSFLVYISTYIYGDPLYLPIDEDHPVRPANPYTHSKWLGENICTFYQEKFNVKSIIIRLFNVYGYGQSINFIIPHIINQIRDKNIILRSITPRRDMLYIKDVVQALILLQNTTHTGIYNLGSGISNSIKEIIENLSVISKINLSYTVDGSTIPYEVQNIVADIGKFTKTFNWQPKYDLYSGLSDLLNQYDL